MKRLAILLGSLMLFTLACTPQGETTEGEPTAGREATPTTSSRATPTQPSRLSPTATPRGGDSADEVSDEEFIAYAIQALSGFSILEARVDSNGAYISYEQVTDALEEDLLEDWMNLAVAALPYLDTPGDVTIVPVTDGQEIARVVIPGGLLAEVLNGERSLQQAIAEIQVLEP